MDTENYEARLDALAQEIETRDKRIAELEAVSKLLRYSIKDREDMADHYISRLKLEGEAERHRTETLLKAWADGIALQPSVMLLTPVETADLLADRERLEWLEAEALASRTGVTISYRKHVEDGGVLERGYRLMRYHEIFEARPTLREAIDSARSVI